MLFTTKFGIVRKEGSSGVLGTPKYVQELQNVSGTPKYVKSFGEGSLSRLGVDRIDL
jgi:aryl-alcohol dehydrogenase-like predicted oxidoreductase